MCRDDIITDATATSRLCATLRQDAVYARRETLKTRRTARATPRLLDGAREQPAVGTTRETTDDSPSCNDWRGRTVNDDTGGVCAARWQRRLSRDFTALLRGLRDRGRVTCAAYRNSSGTAGNDRARTKRFASRFNIKCTTLRGRMSVVRTGRRTDGRVVYIMLQQERRRRFAPR